jgi:hypothetical protein
MQLRNGAFMNQLLCFLLFTIAAPSALAASLPKKMDCKFEGGRYTDFTLSRHALAWRMDFLNDKGMPEFHHRFTNLKFNKNQITGYYLSSFKDEVGGYIVKLTVNNDLSGSIKVRDILMSSQQQRQVMQDENFTCVAAQ